MKIIAGEMLHKYLRAIGFSQIKNNKELQELIKNSIQDADTKTYTNNGGDVVYTEYQKEFAPNVGITIRGEFEEDNKFIFNHYFPYIKGERISCRDDITIERHAEKETYAGVCDDIRVGVSLIFYLQNVVSYLKEKNGNTLPVKGTTLNLSALSCDGVIMMPIIKDELDKSKIKKVSKLRNCLMEAARQGDEEAIESLTLEDMDTYTVISKRIQKEDVFTLVDTYFMPYGVECDQYSILGEILECECVSNRMTKEELYVMIVNCNDLVFSICINKEDTYGEPKVGRRFKGVIWMQGHINYPL